MDSNWTVLTVLFILMLWLGTDVFSKMWHTLMFWVHVASGSQLFKYVMLYTPEGDPPVPEEERDVMGIVFSNDEEYINKIMEVTEK